MKSRILVCGGRDFNDFQLLRQKLDEGAQWWEMEFLIIHGGAKGADRMAGEYAQMYGKPCIEMKAPWMTEGKAAGSIRNGWMLQYTNPDLVVAFPGGNGTANMMRQARAYGVDVWEI